MRNCLLFWVTIHIYRNFIGWQGQIGEPGKPGLFGNYGLEGEKGEQGADGIPVSILSTAVIWQKSIEIIEREVIHYIENE